MTLTEQYFLENVKDHTLTVIKDEGLYRHIRFRKPNTVNRSFDLITWPGYLCYCGDMGTYVFSRLDDMFKFFRTDRTQGHPEDQLHINLSYWSEKLQAVDGNRRATDVMEFSADTFRSVINKFRLQWVRKGNLNKAQRRELWEAVEEEVLDYLDEGEHSVYSRANDFSHNVDGNHFEFTDLWDYNFNEYTHHFTWCCYALAWGIKKYDESKQ